MENENIFLTAEGLVKIKEELDQLKTVERLKVAQMIGEAKSFGDLRENSEYDAAKAREAAVEGRIYQLELMLKNAKIVADKKIDTSKVSIGCKVKLYDEFYDEEIEYKILGELESDPTKGLISNTSPVGKALIGKKVGEVAKVDTPDGIVNFKILAISI